MEKLEKKMSDSAKKRQGKQFYTIFAHKTRKKFVTPV